MTISVEIVHEASGSVVVCDTLDHCLACDDGLRDEADQICAAIERGEQYTVGGGAAEGFIIRRAPVRALTGGAGSNARSDRM